MLTTLIGQLASDAVPGDELILKRGTTPLRIGERERYLYYIHSGLMALQRQEEQLIIVRLGYGGGVLNSLASFLSGEPSEYELAVLRETRVKRIHHHTIQALIHGNKEVKEMYIKTLESAIVDMVERETDVLINSP